MGSNLYTALLQLSSYVSKHLFVHIREGNLEEMLATDILKTFERQAICDSVFQIAEYLESRY